MWILYWLNDAQLHVIIDHNLVFFNIQIRLLEDLQIQEYITIATLIINNQLNLNKNWITGSDLQSNWMTCELML